MDSQPSSYTGRTRRKQTAWHVRIADFLARWCITIGGIGTIVAVSLVFLFLFSVVVPLFLPAEVSEPVARELGGRQVDRVASGQDEFRTAAWWVSDDGTLEVRRLDNGELLLRRPLIEGVVPSAIIQSPGSTAVGVATAEGNLRIGTLTFQTTFPDVADLPAEIAETVKTARFATWKEGVLERTPQGPLRHQSFQATWGPPVKLADAPIASGDLLTISDAGGLGAREVLVAVGTLDGSAKFCRLIEEQNAFTNETNFSASVYDLPPGRKRSGKLAAALVAGRGDNVFLVGEDGWLSRYDVRNVDAIELVEEVQLTSDPQARVTACKFLLGRETLVCGDSRGSLRAWFRVRRESNAATDGQQFAMVHPLVEQGPAITALRASERSRAIAAGDASGRLRVFQVTTEKLVLSRQIADEAITEVAFSPKEDGLMALTDRLLWTASFDPRHPEATVAALFRPVWYEGYDKPQHSWQSSFATSAPEMKLGLLPLIHGTLKATFYAMLFATPLAVLAAVYASEFLHPQMRAVVKPTIEMMASLPSVVLGFLAALVFAVFVETYVLELLCVFFCVPFCFLLASFVWQLLPQSWTVRWQAWRIALMPIPLAAGVGLGFFLGPGVERLFFAGDIIRWLDGQVGSGTGGWLLLVLPLSAVAATGVVSFWINPWLRRRAEQCSRAQFALVNLGKFLAVAVGTLAAAYVMSWLLNAAGWDPRGSYVSTYVQRNAFVVGIVMGFAVIPIIFTIADDALTSVPQHLRSASLGCGATPWQTAIRVVVPTAMSGLFSAVMIGLGRAVGETMIVLMAGGNTPVMEWNLFEGFRTLSANIAVELPEAVRDSTHYRTLFLAALTLFVMTFILNTVAEMVRIRFRRRAVQL